MSVQGQSRDAIERRLVERAAKDPAFRQQLISDPRRAVESELGISLPASANVKVVEESANDVYLVIPPAPSGSGTLSDAQLGAAAGNNSWNDHTCVNAGC